MDIESILLIGKTQVPYFIDDQTFEGEVEDR